jgi:carboxymethylenebutenolidase
VAEDLAAEGYLGGARLFWRIKPGHDAHDEQGLAQSLQLVSRFDLERGVADAEAAYQHLSAPPRARGGLGIVGLCLGGTIA